MSARPKKRRRARMFEFARFGKSIDHINLAKSDCETIVRTMFSSRAQFAQIPVPSRARAFRALPALLPLRLPR
jgi:hypothetical protein